VDEALIVIAKGGHSWCLRGSRVSCCQVISLARCNMESNLCNTLGYGRGLLAVSKCRSGFSRLLIEDFEIVVGYLVVKVC
jgi:hypothetical protein